MPGPQADKQGYTSMFDKINLDMVLKSDRLLRSYFDCVMNRKPCTAEGSELKIILPDALKFGCSKCSENQREGIEKLINYLIANKPDIWKDLEDHLDPKGIYKQKSTTSAEKGEVVGDRNRAMNENWDNCHRPTEAGVRIESPKPPVSHFYAAQN
ncbi:ejaculatory bulb-specific protein 3 [Cloeon dipterum]|uniref:ejaculatory bulb-specific protein 3 n=1 Tax=Cloeon dipterum TaxID=197152 RepID=UPI003220352F